MRRGRFDEAVPASGQFDDDFVQIDGFRARVEEVFGLGLAVHDSVRKDKPGGGLNLCKGAPDYIVAPGDKMDNWTLTFKDPT